ncbi:TonB-dependent receptor [Epilithonimonas ginsengisoli]|uniref:TonB-dependent receptor n=1 Tax=Epilithonimonas ginsengisoli TaxID=1245592 RepID=A0ABU4JFZ8_9FLAO|nr:MULTISPECIES: TonB-dependent receptor plug domain-containing protein [Chryseobacterium group]MBV6879223.1 TonB-dependent receptor [Epilithonimonas sp. FP105]MDW8548594.1 TonB-dependent receptor [Epilithonimonas ginsengisoli]OAH75469.1 TonB-dependent receptor [Chryseobacterium sp. FP211-J200]
MKGLLFLGVFIAPFYFSQTTDSVQVTSIKAVEFTKRTPVAKSIINVDKELADKNLGQDLPILLKNQMSVISTSDAGNGVGYTGLRIRGTAGTSINVMLNGVPYNDSESQGTFFVNVPDLTSSASQIVIQRGVGSSSNGVSAFGASVNVISRDPSDTFSVRTDDSYGSFNTYKYSAEVNSGKFWKNRLSVMGRYTHIHSDGFIDRAFSDLHSYNFSALFQEKNTELRFLAFGGKEKTYQAWNGIDKETWETNPKFNYSGAIYDANWENITSYYDNETDNYRQSHYQFLWNQRFSDAWKLETTAHYTKGKGFYENYKQGDPFARYSLPNLLVNGTEEEYSDFIRKKWLDNDFYGVISTLYGKLGNLDLNVGAVANQYYGKHFGNVTGVFFPQIQESEYYRNRSIKNEVSGFAKAIYKLGQFEIFGDLQVRNIDYDTKIQLAGDSEGADLDRKWTFFNPKAGVNYNIGNGKVFLSYANAHREPNRDDLFDNPDTKEETLHDFEAGWEQQYGKVALSANAYYMYYENQLVLSGRINNIGEFIRENVDRSYRLGLELAANARLSEKIQLGVNLSLSQNKIKEINSVRDEEDTVLKNTDISFSPNMIANGNILYSPFKNFNLGITAQYVGKQYLDNLETTDNRLEDYLVPDFNMSYKLPLAKNEVVLRFLLNNFTDVKYVNNGFSGPYYFSQAGINFMFGVSVKLN